MFFGLFGGVFGIALAYYFGRRNQLNRDRDQHHLASMLIAVAAGSDEVSREDIAAHLRAKGYSRQQGQVRLSHAVTLAGSAVSGELYDGVVALARTFA